MYCINCGRELIIEETDRCPFCGSIINENINNNVSVNKHNIPDNINNNNMNDNINNNLSNNLNNNFNNLNDNNIKASGCGSIILVIIGIVLCFIALKLIFGGLGELGFTIDDLKSSLKSIWNDDSFWSDDNSSSSFFSNNNYNVGNKIITNEFEITVEDVKEKTSIGNNSYSAGTGNTFICIKLKIKNITGKSIGILSQPTFKLKDGKDITYNQDILASLEYLMEIGAGNQPKLNPGVTIYDVGVYKIDKSYYLQNSFSLEICADKIVTVKIK